MADVVHIARSLCLIWACVCWNKILCSWSKVLHVNGVSRGYLHLRHVLGRWVLHLDYRREGGAPASLQNTVLPRASHEYLTQTSQVVVVVEHRKKDPHQQLPLRD